MWIQISSMSQINKDKVWITLMKIGKWYGCHQRADRSFSYRGYQFPVCARCTGIILGTLGAYLGYRYKRYPFWLEIAFVLSMVVDGGLQLLKIKESNNCRRLITGILGGFSITTLKLQLCGLLRKMNEIPKGEV